MHPITDPTPETLRPFTHAAAALEMFAGPGGMSEGIARAGHDPATTLGIEIDPDAATTATRAGHPRLLGDVLRLSPGLFRGVGYLHASPPCQGFSRAGNGIGRRDMDMCADAVNAAASDPSRIDTIMGNLAAFVIDPQAVLAVEPLRWVIHLQPHTVTLEQVPTVLPLWTAYTHALTRLGYSTWAGRVHSEQYGVPQTRTRAVLIASTKRDVKAGLEPTHSRYYSHGKKRGQLDLGVPIFVTMADALGWNVPDGTTHMGDVRAGHGTIRPLHDPAPTLTASMDNGNFQWISRVKAEVESRTRNQSGEPFDIEWPAHRPALVIATRGLVPHPGSNANRHQPGVKKSRNDGIRITVAEAGILQTFQPDYPWTGNQTEQFRQAGNAVPPELGKAITRATEPT